MQADNPDGDLLDTYSAITSGDLLDTITTHEPPDKDLKHLAETTDAAYIDDLDDIYSAIQSEEWDCR